MKKILIFGISKDSMSGGQVMMFNLIKNLDKSKFDVHVRLQTECPLSEQLMNENVTISYKEFPKLFNILEKIRALIVVLPLIRIIYSYFYFYDIREQKFDFIWCENLTTLLTASKFKISSTKLIANMWSNLNSRGALQLMNVFSDHIIVEAEFQKNKFIDICDMNKVTVINTQISPTVFKQESAVLEIYSELEDKINSKVIGFLGGCRYSKGFDLLVDISYKLIVEQELTNFYVLCFGSNEDDDLLNNPELFDKIIRMGKNFIIKSWISNTKQFYFNIDLFLSLSRSEGLPGTVRETMGYGVPVIGSNVGGTLEVLNNPYLIVNIDERDIAVSEFTSKIYNLLNNNSYYNEISKELKDRASKLYIGYDWVNRLQNVMLNLE